MVDSNSSIEKTRAKDEERNVFLVFLAKPSMENLARETISFDIYLVDTINKVSGRKKKIQIGGIVSHHLGGISIERNGKLDSSTPTPSLISLSLSLPSIKTSR